MYLKTNLKTLQVQNNALRIILKKPLLAKTKIIDLHKEANIELHMTVNREHILKKNDLIFKIMYFLFYSVYG